jgi:hypothetical protein
MKIQKIEQRAKDRELNPEFFYQLKHHHTKGNINRVSKYRYCMFLGNGDVVKGYDKYMEMCFDMSNKICDMLYDCGTSWKLARKILGKEAKKGKVISLYTTIERSIIVPKKGYLATKFRRLRRIIRSYENEKYTT